MNLFLGISASTGIGIGRAFVVPELQKRVIPQDTILSSDRVAELAKFDASVASVVTQIAAQMDAAFDNKAQREILETYFLMLNDLEFIGSVKKAFSQNNKNIAWILNQKTEESARLLAASGNEYLSERAQDIRDVFGRVLDELLDYHPFKIENVPDGAVIVARSLSPSDTLILSKRRIAGIALIEGGVSSHVGILARSYGVPAVFALHKITEEIKVGDLVVVDGNAGEVVVEPNGETLDEYRKKISAEQEKKQHLSLFRTKTAQTRDGVQFKIMANIGTVEEAENAAREGADGIGLFRTEFLFMEEENEGISAAHARSVAFSEEGQFRAYKKVLLTMGEKPVTIRTLDAGGDKIIGVAEISSAEEKNPLMGLRAIRLSLSYPNQLKTQFKALFRAGVYGNLKIMLPLITGVSQIEKSLEIANKAKQELLDSGTEFKDDIPIGIMVETASAAVISDLLAKKSAFFSIGTNDLTQYTLGVDRENAQVSSLYDEFHPAVLRLIEKTVESAANAKIDISVCGEMAGRSESALVLAGLGIRTFSMSAQKITEIKELLSRYSISELQKIATQKKESQNVGKK